MNEQSHLEESHGFSKDAFKHFSYQDDSDLGLMYLIRMDEEIFDITQLSKYFQSVKIDSGVYEKM